MPNILIEGNHNDKQKNSAITTNLFCTAICYVNGISSYINIISWDESTIDIITKILIVLITSTTYFTIFTKQYLIELYR